MASSFEYFADDEGNRKIISEAFRLLMAEGKLLLDLPNRGLRKHDQPHGRHCEEGRLTFKQRDSYSYVFRLVTTSPSVVQIESGAAHT